MDMQYSCHGDDLQSVLYPTSNSCHTSPGDFMTLDAASGLGLTFESQSQSHTPLLEDHIPITSQNYLDSLFSSAPALSVLAQDNAPDLWSSPEYFNSSAPNQSPWPTTQYHQTPLLSSPNITAGHPQRHSNYDSIPGLYSSPGTTVSTRCDTPSSVTSGAEEMKPSLSGMGLTPVSTPHDPFSWYGIPHSSPSMTLGIITHESHRALLASTSCSPDETASLYETSDLEHVKEELDDTITGLSRLQSPEIDDTTRKIQIMEERTRLKRQRLAPVPPNGEKPECPKCHKLFSRKHNLRQHQVTSCSLLPQRNREFACGDCPKTFHRQTDLQRHKASKHSEVKEFKCEMCEQTFPRKDTLRRHFINSCKKTQRQPRKDRKGRRRLEASAALI